MSTWATVAAATVLGETEGAAGGEGENIFKSFLLQEYGKQVAKAGGIGVSAMVQKQLLQLQEAPR